MTGAQLAAIRKRLGLSLVGMGRALGYEGNRSALAELDALENKFYS